MNNLEQWQRQYRRDLRRRHMSVLRECAASDRRGNVVLLIGIPLVIIVMAIATYDTIRDVALTDKRNVVRESR